jgi:hypothetical protein
MFEGYAYPFLAVDRKQLLIFIHPAIVVGSGSAYLPLQALPVL